jgi:DNA-binding transcriptional ArsR family regulator
MTRPDVLRLIGTVAWVLVLALVVPERRLIRRLRAAGAISADTAASIALRPPIARLPLKRLQNAGAVIAATSGRFYLDEAAYDRYRAARRRRAVPVLAVAMLLILLIVWQAG